MKVKLKDRQTEVGGSLNKILLFIGNYYYYEMCFLKGKMSAPKRPKDNTKNSIKPKNYPKISKTLRVFN